MIGTVLQETYRLEQLIGEGGAGAVYEASHLRLARRFAVKILNAKVAEHPEAMERFRREALITSGLGHRNILEVTDFNETADGALFMVTELLSGEPLDERIRSRGGLELKAALDIVEQIASAMQAAHDAAVVHRDLKPPNVFLCARDGRDDFVKVVDFGISKVLTSTANLTTEAALLGTPFYMSPEQAEQRAGAADHRADIYALGVILHEMLTGAPPFTGDSLHGILYKVVNQPPPPVRDQRPEIPEQIDRAIARAMAKKPKERFASMSAFWDELASCPVPAAEKTKRSGRRAPAALPAAQTRGTSTTLSSSTGELQLPTQVVQQKRSVLFLSVVGIGVLAVSVVVFFAISRVPEVDREPAGQERPPAAVINAGTDRRVPARAAPVGVETTTLAAPARDAAPDARPAPDAGAAPDLEADTADVPLGKPRGPDEIRRPVKKARRPARRRIRAVKKPPGATRVPVNEPEKRPKKKEPTYPRHTVGDPTFE